MKKGIIVNIKRLKILDYVTLNKLFILIFACFVLGVSVGSTVFKNSFLLENAEYIFENFILLHTTKTFFKKIIVCFFRYVIILLVYFLSGTSMFGVAIIPFVVVWQGVISSSVIAYLYSQYGINGIAFNAVIFIPPTICFTICCFFAAKNSINFSLNIAKLTLPKHSAINLNICFKNYCIQYLISVAVMLCCALIEILLNSLFLNFFNF